MGSQNAKGIQALLNELVEHTDSWAAGVMIPNSDKSKLIPAFTVNFPIGWKNMHNVLDKSTGVGEAFLNQETILIQDKHIGQPTGSSVSHFMSAIAAIPILNSEGSSIATLEVIKDEIGAHFSDVELTYLKDIVKMLATLINE